MNELLDPTLDVLPKLLIEIRDDEVVDSIVDGRVRGKEAQGPVLDAQGRQLYPGDARPAGEYVPFVVLRRLGSPPHPRVPIQTARILFQCYGRDDREAAVLRNACARVVHGAAPRVFANGLGIYASHDISGGTQEADPDTQQPMESFVVEAVATAQAVV